MYVCFSDVDFPLCKFSWSGKMCSS